MLIEKARSSLTDGTGQYRITDLLPGTYTLTFTLSGFATVKREGVEVTGSGVTTINADMRVGNVAETVNVSGETPVVDVQTTRRQEVLTQEVVRSVPATRGYNAHPGDDPVGEHLRVLQRRGTEQHAIVAGHDDLHQPWRARQRRARAGRRPQRRRGVQRRRRVRLHHGHRGCAGTAVHAFGWVGRSRDRRDQPQYRAEDGRQPVRGAVLHQHRGQLVGVGQHRRQPARARHHTKWARQELGRERIGRRPDQTGHAVVLCQRPRFRHAQHRPGRVPEPECRRRRPSGRTQRIRATPFVPRTPRRWDRSA